jgi:hypothetical protein
LADWLSDMLQMDVNLADKSEGKVGFSPALNLLEGMRTGLLKIGNQHYDFVGGRFVASVGAAGATVSEPSLGSKWKMASSQPVTLETLKPFAFPATAAALLIGLIVGVYSFVISPVDEASEANASFYSSALSRVDHGGKNMGRTTSEPVLWSRDVVSVAAAMPYDMKLKRLALVTGPGTAGTTFEISGALPKDGKDNLQLIGRFITRLTTAPGLRRRFSEVTFAGVGQGDTKDSDESPFKIVGRVVGGSTP